jgi:hypothetical protein
MAENGNLKALLLEILPDIEMHQRLLENHWPPDPEWLLKVTRLEIQKCKIKEATDGFVIEDGYDTTRRV